MDRSSLQHYFLVSLILGALLLTFFVFQPFLAPLVLGAVFAVVLQPLHRRIHSFLSGSESLASLLTVAISIVVILVPVGFLGTQLLIEAQGLYQDLTAEDRTDSLITVINSTGETLDQYIPGAGESLAGFSAEIDTYTKAGLTWLIQHLGVAFSSVASLFLALFIFFVTLYYLLRDGAKLRRYLISLSPLSDRDDVYIFDRLELAVNSVVKGKLAIALAQGTLTGVGFALFGVPSPVLWGLVAAVASLVPPIGTALVIAPGVVFLFVTGSPIAAIGLTIWGALAVGLIDNFLGPILMSEGMRLHPLLVLLSVLGGIPFFGPIGIFLGPLTVSLLLALLSVYTYLMDGKGRA